ncbi:hypothetical protein HPB51_023626 [Rhipicephalus microplus]|uniref:Uncharacterized protein n=1 Tax=Rhipicephalus microplus TaxID=6941 RepID=A0A9J6DDE4_RHIMP|nr:hypothetical protein HPB51_023626 [Rhipicephalus microplus]
MDVYKPTQDDMIRAEEKLQARLDQLGVVSDSGETKTFLNEVVDKVSDVVDVVASCHDDTMSTKSEAGPLLSYLDAEKKLCTTKRIEIAALRRRLVTRPGNDDSAAPPIDSELIRRIESIVSGAAAEYKECREEQYCAVLVRELTDVCVDAESWTESSTDARYAKRPTLLHRALLKAARLALSRLVEKQVRDGLGENNETGLPKELARCATLAVKMDVDGARNCLHVQDLLAKREKLAARVRTLQAQKKRLRRVRGNVEQSERLLANVTLEVSALRDSLASRVRLCQSVVAAAIDAQARQENATDAAVATTPVCLDQDPVATSVYRLCSQQVAAIAAKADQLDEMALRRQRANELVDRLEVDMIARCQGSTSKWLDDVRAAIPEKQNKNLLLKRALLIEFHENPQRFVARMKSATLLKKRGALPHITQKEDDAQHP